MGTYNGYYEINTVDLIDVFYPVGTIYETKDANFNPNTVWGGTWIKITDKFLVAAGSTYSGTGGSASQSITLSTSNLPSHRHSFTPSGSVSVSSNPSWSGSFSGNEITGQIESANNTAFAMSVSGCFRGENKTADHHHYTGSGYNTRNVIFSATPSGSVSGSISGGSYSFSGTAGNTGYKGDGAAFTVDTVPPYQAVYIWERTA